MKPEDTGKKPSDNVLDSDKHFQAIIQLLQLVLALLPGEHKHQSDKLTGDGPSGTGKSFDFVDAITNLMVRNDEVVAAVACGSPSRGIISVNSSNETPSHKNANLKVRPHYTHIFSIPQIHPQPAPMDNEMEIEEMELSLSPDLYDHESPGAYLQVATVANSKISRSEDFEGVAKSADFTPCLTPNATSLWDKLKLCMPEDVNSSSDRDTSRMPSLFRASFTIPSCSSASETLSCIMAFFDHNSPKYSSISSICLEAEYFSASSEAHTALTKASNWQAVLWE